MEPPEGDGSAAGSGHSDLSSDEDSDHVGVAERLQPQEKPPAQLRFDGSDANAAVAETLSLPHAGFARLLTAQERRPVWLVLTASHLRCYDNEAGAGDWDDAIVDPSGGRELIKEIELDPDRIADQIDLLPDSARRSRHQSGLFPFHIAAVAEGANDQAAIGRAAERDGLLLAVDTAAAMWAWAKKIRWRGERPAVIESPPHLHIDRETQTNPHYSVPRVIQERLLLDDFYQADRGFARRWRETIAHACTGACIHRAERNFEMILSTNLLDLERMTRLFNSPLSMCAEGHYSTSRTHIAHHLVKSGHGIGRGVTAANHRFVTMICKPTSSGESWWWMDAKLRNAPVHPEDKELVKWLIAKGDGVDDNELLLEKMATAAAAGAAKFEFRSRLGATVFAIPDEPAVGVWAMDTLREINLSHNAITTLPDAFYQLHNLQKANLSNNALWVMSPNIKVMQALQTLNVHNNCLEGLPDELELMPSLVELTCHGNRIQYPPRAIVDGGLDAIRAFFLGIRTHGKVANTDIKVLVVGLSEAGKTSLINAVVTDGSQLVRRGDRTVGIEQKRWTFPWLDPAFATVDSVIDQVYVSSDFPFEYHFGASETTCAMHIPAQMAQEQGFRLIDPDTGDMMPPGPQQLTECTWDSTTRTFVGEVSWEAPGLGRHFTRTKFELTFSEDFETVIDGAVTMITATGEEEQIEGGLDRCRRKLPTRGDVHCLFYDFAGQQEYYSSHHIFLTERALYVLAFDLTKYSNATFQDQVLFWASAIQERVPGSKVLVVGTHADGLPFGEAESVCDKVKNALRNVRRRAKRVLDRKCKQAGEDIQPLDQIKDAHARQVLSAKSGQPVVELEHLVERKRRGLSEEQAAILEELDEVHRLGGTLSKDETKDRERFARLREEHGVDPLTATEEGIVKELERLAEQAGILSPGDQAKYNHLNANLKRWQSMYMSLLAVPDIVHPVSSAEGLQGMPKFVEAIKGAVLDQHYFPQLGEFTPTYYLQVRRAIRAKREERKFAFMKLDTYLTMLSTDLGISESQVEEATEFMHVLGEILYYKEHKVVFLKVQFLIDAFKFVIRHDHADATAYDEDVSDMTESMFQHCKQALIQRGDLRMSFLELLWAPSPPEGLGLSPDSEESDKFDAMVALLEKFEIAGVVSRRNGEALQFIVPEFEQMNLPDTAWNLKCPVGQIQAYRCFQFDRAVPRGLMQRLQIKLCKHSQGGASEFARDGTVLHMWGTLVLLVIRKGVNPAAPYQIGLSCVVRGGDPTAVWRTTNSIVQLIDATLDQWPGVGFEHFVVLENEADVSFLSLDLLQNERAAGLTSTMVLQAPVDIVSLIGPETAGTWVDQSGNLIQASATVSGAMGNVDDDLDMDAELQAQAHSDSVRAVQVCREEHVPWAMLIHSAAGDTIASQLAQGLHNARVPCWLLKFAGAHPTETARENDGLTHAGTICPIVDASFESDPGARRQLDAALELGLEVVPVATDSGLDLGWLDELLTSHEHETCPTLLYTQGAVGAVVEAIRSTGMASMLPASATNRQQLVERRKSFSHDNADSGAKGAAAAASSKGLFMLETLLGVQLKLPKKFVDPYCRSLRASFRELYENENDDLILFYGADGSLEEAGIGVGPHRKMILMWIENALLERKALTVASPARARIARMATKDMKVVFVSYFANESQGLFQHLVSTVGLTNRRVFEPTRELHNPSEVEMRENVAGSDLVLAIMSKGYFGSKWCRAEVDEAMKRGIVVIPVYDGDEILQKDALKLKLPGDKLCNFVFSKNLCMVKNVQNQTNCTKMLAGVLDIHCPVD